MRAWGRNDVLHNRQASQNATQLRWGRAEAQQGHQALHGQRQQCLSVHIGRVPLFLFAAPTARRSLRAHEGKDDHLACLQQLATCQGCTTWLTPPPKCNAQTELYQRWPLLGNAMLALT